MAEVAAVAAVAAAEAAVAVAVAVDVVPQLSHHIVLVVIELR